MDIFETIRPAEYIQIRDNLIASGMSKTNANKIASAEFKKRHQTGVRAAAREQSPKINKEKKKRMKESISQIILKEIAGMTGLIASPPVSTVSNIGGSGSGSSTSTAGPTSNQSKSTQDDKKSSSSSSKQSGSNSGVNKKNLPKATITTASSLLGKRMGEEIEAEFNIQ